MDEAPVKRPVGRPRKEVDESMILDLASIMCTNEEICDMCGISEDTLILNFAGVLREGRSTGKKSVRRQQYDLLKQGNAAMGVWLGKVYLGQKDTTHVLNESIPTPRIPEAAIAMKKPDND